MTERTKQRRLLIFLYVTLGESNTMVVRELLEHNLRVTEHEVNSWVRKNVGVLERYVTAFDKDFPLELRDIKQGEVPALVVKLE